jgi:hypothetical protein
MIVAGLDIEDVLYPSIDARGWEDCDSSCFAGTSELQAALDTFVAANRDMVSYRENPKKAILVGALCRETIQQNHTIVSRINS